MKVFVKGKGEVTLTQANFVAQGGQAAVYQRNGTAYKVYLDPKDAIPETKFRELSSIDDPHVVRPESLLLGDKSAQPVGYTMQYVSDTYALCQLFPKSFRERNGLDEHKAQNLVERLMAHVSSVHRAGAIIVDLNELNVLANHALDELYMIDVDSYQTASFKAEVIMPSVRDWSVKPEQFSALSDWFSFSILAFQLYIGIHPYKGSHDASAGVPPDKRLEHRMRHNLSALGPGVSLPKICPPLDVIPGQLREWMRAVLQDGKRLPPPDPRAPAPVAATVARPASARLFGAGILVTEVGEFVGDVLAYAESGGTELVLTKEGLFANRRLVRRGLATGTTLVGFVPKTNEEITVNLCKGEVTVTPLRGNAVVLPFAGSEIARGRDGFYVRSRDKVLELEIAQTGGKLVITGRVVANVLEHASRLYEGCCVQSMLGSAFVSLFPRARAGYQVRIPELDSYRVMDAKFDGGVLMVVGAKGGRYDRLVFRFDETFSSYDTRTIPGITPAGLNFLVTPSGVCVSVTEDEKIEAFSVIRGAPGVRVVEDPAVGGDMRLMTVAGQPGFSRENRLFTMRMK